MTECSVCGESASFKCPTCHCPYCGEGCQRDDWHHHGHRLTCGKPSTLTTGVTIPWISCNNALDNDDIPEAIRFASEFNQNVTHIMNTVQVELPRALEALGVTLAPLDKSVQVMVDLTCSAFALALDELNDLDRRFATRLKDSRVILNETLFNLVCTTAQQEQARIFDQLTVRSERALNSDLYQSYAPATLFNNNDPIIVDYILIRLRRMHRELEVFRTVDAALEESTPSPGPTVEEIQARMAGRTTKRDDPYRRGQPPPAAPPPGPPQPPPGPAFVDDATEDGDDNVKFLGFGSGARLEKFLDLVFETKWEVSNTLVWLLENVLDVAQGEVIRAVYQHIHSAFVKSEFEKIVRGRAVFNENQEARIRELILDWRFEDIEAQKDGNHRTRQDAAVTLFGRIIALDPALLTIEELFWVDITFAMTDILRTIAAAGLLGKNNFVTAVNALSPSVALKNWVASFPEEIFAAVQSHIDGFLEHDAKASIIDILVTHPNATHFKLETGKVVNGTVPKFLRLLDEYDLTRSLPIAIPPALERFADVSNAENINNLGNLIAHLPGIPELPKNTYGSDLIPSLLASMKELMAPAKAVTYTSSVLKTAGSFAASFLSLVDQRTLDYVAAAAVATAASPPWDLSQENARTLPQIATALFLASRLSACSEYVTRTFSAGLGLFLARLGVQFLQEFEYDALEKEQEYKSIIPAGLTEFEYRRLIAPNGLLSAGRIIAKRLFRVVSRTFNPMDYGKLERGFVSPTGRTMTTAMTKLHLEFARSKSHIKQATSMDTRLLLYGMGNLLVIVGSTGVAWTVMPLESPSRPSTVYDKVMDGANNFLSNEAQGELAKEYWVVRKAQSVGRTIGIVGVRGQALVTLLGVIGYGFYNYRLLFPTININQPAPAPVPVVVAPVTPRGRVRRASGVVPPQNAIVPIRPPGAVTKIGTFFKNVLLANWHLIVLLSFFSLVISEFNKVGLSEYAPIRGLLRSARERVPLQSLLNTARQVMGGNSGKMYLSTKK